MSIHTRLPVATMPGVNALYRDYVSSPSSPVHEWLPSFVAGADVWKHAGAEVRTVDAALVAAMRAYNQELHVDPAVCGRLSGLADGSVRAVVTGQQPGVMGGPLLALYKAASAIALARRIEKITGRACVPLFWMGSDDDDFAEVRELSILAQDHARIDVSIEASAYRPGLRVGDIAAGAVRGVWNAVSPSLAPGRAHDHLSAAAAAAGDFGDAGARALVAATAGQIAVVDGRAPALRTAARDLLLGFFDREARLRESMEETGRELEARGYHAQIQWGSDSGLFMVEGGIRQRVPADQRAAVRAQFERDITRVSPGVVARNLLQDATLAPMAVVLGPAEIAYRAQMAGVYREMKVPMPVVAPRLSATYLPSVVRDMMAELAIDGGEIALDPDAVVVAAGERAASDGLKAAASALEAAFARDAAAFLEKASARLDERARQKLEKRIDEIAGRLAQTVATAIEHDSEGARARWPFLPRMADMFLKDAMAQERFLSLLTPMLFHGDDAFRQIDALADEWAGDMLDGRVWHGVYSV